jgi:hypothetical protein
VRERERDRSARNEVKASEQRAGETAASKGRERNGVGRARVSEQRAASKRRRRASSEQGRPAAAAARKGAGAAVAASERGEGEERSGD